jgi:GxxExxY protein
MHEVNQITGAIVSVAYDVHSKLGPGLIEKVYETVLERALLQRGLRIERQKPISFEFEGMRFENAFCVDLLVEDQVVVELKSVEKLSPLHQKQLLTYLRLLNLPVGLLINFGSASLNQGVQRIANAHAESARVVLTPRREPTKDNLTQGHQS